MNESTSVDQTDQAASSELSERSICPAENEGEHCQAMPPLKKPVLFFDGVCGLCNSSVDFAIARDKYSRLFYSPLQGETAKQLLRDDQTCNISTVILRTADGKHFYQRSAAIVRLLWLLGFPWNLLGCVLWCIPLPIRDIGYRIVAGSRYRLFEKHTTCRIPTPEERDRILP
ncbi:MAG: DCC1-like thiol-disulfide oxidoreductase family protein [Gimesia sp.]